MYVNCFVNCFDTDGNLLQYNFHTYNLILIKVRIIMSGVKYLFLAANGGRHSRMAKLAKIFEEHLV